MHTRHRLAYIFLILFQMCLLVSAQDDDEAASENDIAINQYHKNLTPNMPETSLNDVLKPLVRELRHNEVNIHLLEEATLVEPLQGLEAFSEHEPEGIQFSESVPPPSEQTCQYVFTVPQSPHCSGVDTEDRMSEMQIAFRNLQGQMTVQRKRIDFAEGIIRKFRSVVHQRREGHGSNPTQRPTRPEPTTGSASRGNEASKALEHLSEYLQVQLSNLDIQIDDSERIRWKLEEDNRNLTRLTSQQTMRIHNLTEANVLLHETVMSLQRDLDTARRENTAVAESNRLLTLQKTDLEESSGLLAQRLGKLSLANEKMGNEIISLKTDAVLLRHANQQIRQNATTRIRELRTLLSKSNPTGAKPKHCADVISGPKDEMEENFPNYTHCGRLISVGQPETVRESKRTILRKVGVWMRDPLAPPGSHRIWAIIIIGKKIRKLMQYYNMSNFQSYSPEARYDLPVPIESNGAVVYNGSLYYQRRNSRKIVRYVIGSNKAPKERALRRAGFHGMFAYSWGGYTDIDFAVDETGLWVIYSTRQNRGNILVSKINPVTLRIIKTIRTTIPKVKVANAFIICEVLYTVSSYSAENARINYSFDFNTKNRTKMDIPFANFYRFNTMIDYNPRDRHIYSWDSGRQVRYLTSVDDSKGEIRNDGRRLSTTTS
ncbi:unnamed protein product [Clavelina lepadiformis]|uniref:Myocilin n=1 Tax=Clavelina lepadiformis TaxID=159417 RepID=A0ABP0F512_CLALP